MYINTAIEKNVTAALAEDIGSGDLTALLIPQEQEATASVISRERATLCGSAWFEACFRRLDPAVRIQWFAKDGDCIAPDQMLCEMRGNARVLLSAERPALNFLQTLSGTATLARRYAEAIAGTGAVVMDTRKTLPGLRMAQKYAVKTGGGANQRIGLFDGILIKENHIMATGGIRQALESAMNIAPADVSIQIEVEGLDELDVALNAGAKLILLDNFSLDKLRAAVALNANRAILEASGGITLDNIRAVAETGVNRISVGSLTKDVKAVDLSMRFNGS
jgi:nicotinate-nucleotide pyrophosphorylase (carboxylating)